MLKYLIIIFISLIFGFIYNKIDNYNSKEKDNNTENFISTISSYVNLGTANPLDIDGKKEYISLKSPIPANKYNMGIEEKNSIDAMIAGYFKHNIIPIHDIFKMNNDDIIKNVANKKLKFGLVREYKLLNIISKNKKIGNKLKVIIPTYKKYILCLTGGNNDIAFIEDLNDTDIFPRKEQRICYINEDDLDIVESIIQLQKLKKEKRDKIVFRKIKSLEEVENYDIFIGLITPENVSNKIVELKLKPIQFIPRDRVPSSTERRNLDIKVNKDDIDQIREFHYDLKNEYDWSFNAIIYPTINSPGYRTYGIRYLLITGISDNENISTMLKNIYQHRLQLKNIFNVKSNLLNRRHYGHISNNFTDLAALPKQLAFHPSTVLFLKSMKLLS